MSNKKPKSITVGVNGHDRIQAGAAFPNEFHVITDPKHPLYREPGTAVRAEPRSRR
jgi:hypothetical protein